MGDRGVSYVAAIPGVHVRPIRAFTLGRHAHERRLRDDLAREGLADTDDKRNTSTVKVGGRTQRVLRLRRAAVEAVVGVAFPVTG